MAHFAPTALSAVVYLGTFHKQNLIRCEVITVEEVAITMYTVNKSHHHGYAVADAHMKSHVKGLLPDQINDFGSVICTKGSCTYYVITFGGPERPLPPYVIL